MTQSISLTMSGGTFFISVGSECGSIRSDLHFGTIEDFLEAGSEESNNPQHDQFNYGRYEGAIDALESMILAAAQAGIDIHAEPFKTALQTPLDAICSYL